jgi:hypothetical protein
LWVLVTHLPYDSYTVRAYEAAQKAALKPTEDKIRDRAAHYAELARQQEEASE